MGRLRISSATKTAWWGNQHRFEHWYRDNSVYFVTSKVRDGLHAFRTEPAKRIFWERFEHYTKEYEFERWVESLMDNHYHFVGYLRRGENLGRMMQRIHGSVAKLVNDLLPSRHVPFWRFAGNQDYFDGCLREETQVRNASQYVLRQAIRARLVSDWREYPHTRLHVDLDERIQHALEAGAIPIPLEYRRYRRAGEPRS